MRIAFFVEIFYPEINGVLTATLDLARNLREQGHSVLFVVPKAKGCRDVREVYGMEVFQVPAIPSYIYPGIRFVSSRSRSLRRKLREERIEILHIGAPGTMALAAVNYAKKFTVPLVETFHTFIDEDKYLLYLVKLRALLPVGRFLARLFIKWATRDCALVTAPARFTCERLKERFPEKDVRWIVNGIDFSFFGNPSGREEFLGRYPFFTEKTFIFVGRVGIEKAIDVLIRGFAAAAKEDPSLRLVIVGDGPSRGDMESLVVKAGAADAIFLLGKIAHAELLGSGLLHYSRAFITASLTENQPMTIIEAMYCGLPLVLADSQALVELGGRAALVFPAGDEAALKDCILRMAVDDRLHAELGAVSRSEAQKYDGRNVARQFGEEFTRLLAEKR
ncbi:MAG: glycosyltransferase [Spirochaetaceae bacterium]|nr:glycosyltransferase [Spirochaetaceae bacterium]